MQTFDEKVDTAVHVAFEALGLSVGANIDLAYRLNDFITQEFQFVLSDDDADEDVGDITPAGGLGHD
ncbi:hypothetical protein HOY34_07790 [Xinfangfangia sp. D13-10-4-6]|uniref:hypothetical protein n=1 Tax=Pseudogemmobacter hezensis TaxID=2737662 RepID=UPI0015581BCD|nr:hypothetical protein [Pseudogemmobacter hezensis]NPD15102.1 hypothetical protein [Pseudogemmobacter hezensis]